MPLTGGGGGGGNTYVAPFGTALTDMSTLTADVDLIATPPTGWVWHNSANLTSCTQNPSSNGYLSAVLKADVTNSGKYWPSTYNAPRLHKPLLMPVLSGLVFARLRGDNVGNEAGKHEGIEMYIAAKYAVGSERAHHFVGICKGTDNNHSARGGYPGVQLQKVLTDNTYESDQITQGVWVGMQFTPKGVYYLYDETNSIVPPHERAEGWTDIGYLKWYAADEPNDGVDDGGYEVGFLFNSYGSTAPDGVVEVMHFDDRALYAPTDIASPDPCFGIP